MAGATGPRDLVTSAAAALAPLAYSPTLQSGFWSPKVALLMPTAVLGVTPLVALLRRCDRSAIAGAAFVAVCMLSASLSDRPVLSLLGLYGWGTGALFWLSCLLLWAAGRAMTGRGTRLLGTAILAGATTSALIGIAQVSIDLSFMGLEPYAGRAYGLLGNPIHLGGLAGAAICLLAARWSSIDMRVGAPMAAVLAAGLQASGTRVALLAVLPLLAVIMIRHRRLSTNVAIAAALAVGFLGGGVLPRLEGTTSALDRAAGGTTSSSATARLETWSSARHAVAEQPILGAGPGRFRTATSPFRTLKLEQAEGAERIFVDAHNIFVELAVTVGSAGLILFLIWLALTRPTGDFSLLAFAGALGVVALAQPLTVGTTPVAFLALGAAAKEHLSLTRHGGKWGTGLAIGVGTAISAAMGVLLLGDYLAREATLDLEIRKARGAEDLLPPWPQLATITARAQLYRSILAAPDDPLLLREAVHWRREAVRRDPSEPALHNELGEILLVVPDVDAAYMAFSGALDRDPQSFRALIGLARCLEARGDNAGARSLAEEAHSRATQADQSEVAKSIIERNAKKPAP